MSHPADVFYLRLTRHTGAVILWQQRSYTATGTLEKCEAAYRAAQTYNLLVGWWSLGSLVALNWVALISNLKAIRQVRAMANEAPTHHMLPASPTVAPTSRPSGPPATMPAGWYRDPSGAGQRYWDGATWTHWTHPSSYR